MQGNDSTREASATVLAFVWDTFEISVVETLGVPLGNVFYLFRLFRLFLFSFRCVMAAFSVFIFFVSFVFFALSPPQLLVLSSRT